MEKKAKIVPFFYKERKRTQRLERSFEKNGCPTLHRRKPGNNVTERFKILYVPRSKVNIAAYYSGTV